MTYALAPLWPIFILLALPETEEELREPVIWPTCHSIAKKTFSTLKPYPLVFVISTYL